MSAVPSFRRRRFNFVRRVTMAMVVTCLVAAAQPANAQPSPVGPGGGALVIQSAFRETMDEAARDSAREWIRAHPHRASNSNVTRRSLLLGAGIGAAIGAFFGVASAHALGGEQHPAKVMMMVTGGFAAIGAAVAYRR